MKTSDFYYELPQELIAQTPVEPRDCSRLLVYDRTTGSRSDKHFYNLPDYLNEKDVLVINETKVIPARLFGTKHTTGLHVELLLLHERCRLEWETLLRPGRRLRVGDQVDFSERLRAEILEKREDGVAIVRFFCEGVFEAILDELGQTPLPPYITEKLEDQSRYQTVYAKERGSAAAPTAGLHFTNALLEKIKEMGVDIVPILLHVGLGTFRPVKSETIETHQMHSEYYCISQDAAQRINAARACGGRIVAVGTTSVRTLESVADEKGIIQAGSGSTNIFIYPGYRFRAVDALITNFHLPESTLLMLVSAMIGREQALSLYSEAVEKKYRFFSFGDAMLVV